jgi:hypothetical protein
MIRSFASASAAVFAGLLLAGSAMAQTTTAPKGQMKLTQAECTSIWNTLDSTKAGSVSEAQAQAHVTNFDSVDANKDGKLSRAEFQSGCDRGQVHSSASTGTGTGTSGGAKKN